MSTDGGEALEKLLEILTRRHVEVLMRMRACGSLMLKDVRAIARVDYYRARKLMEDLKSAGIVIEERYGRTRVYRLTERGVMILDALKKLAEVLWE